MNKLAKKNQGMVWECLAALAAIILYSGLAVAAESNREYLAGSIRVSSQEADFPSLAKVSFAQAMDIVQTTVQGDLLAIALEDEDGFLVYQAEVVTPAKSVQEIDVDAGTGKVLQVEFDEKDDD